MDWIGRLFPTIEETFGVQFFLSPLYLGATVLIACLVWLRSDRKQGFLAFAFPKKIYQHPSTRVDIKLAAFNTLFIGAGAIATLLFTPWVTLEVHSFLVHLTNYELTANTTGRSIIAGGLIFLTQDFSRYCIHYLHHQLQYLWPFHAVHHSAEVMTPITFMRAHPMYSALQAILISLLVGTVQAIVLFIVIGELTTTATYIGTFAFSIYVFFGAHIRHSHIWLSYGRKLEHIFISPAQHQIHHSTDVKHHDKNYGEVFAIWDWMFGTLYIPENKEDLTYGLADQNGALIEQRYPTLRTALIGPFEEVWRKVIRNTSGNRTTNP